MWPLLGMRIAESALERLRIWWQRIWCTILRAFHIAVAVTFLMIAIAFGQKAFLAWRSYQNNPQEGPWYLYIWVGTVTILIIFSLYSLLKARTIR